MTDAGIVTGRDVVGAETLGDRVEKGAKFDFAVTVVVRIGRNPYPIAFQSVGKDARPVLSNKVGLGQNVENQKTTIKTVLVVSAGNALG